MVPPTDASTAVGAISGTKRYATQWSIIPVYWALIFSSFASRPYFSYSFLYEPGELRTAATDRLLVGFEKMLPDGGISERLADLAIEAVNNRGRRAGWNEHADPLVEDHSVDAGLLKGRYVRQSRRAPFRRLRK